VTTIGSVAAAVSGSALRFVVVVVVVYIIFDMFVFWTIMKR
jgi:hypothetical protein